MGKRNFPYIRTRTFTLPGQEAVIESIANNDLTVITRKDLMPCPKEGIIMVYLEYEDYNEIVLDDYSEGVD